MFAKNLVLDLWSKKPENKSDCRMFKVQYLTKNLRYEVEFLDMTRGLRKH